MKINELTVSAHDDGTSTVQVWVMCNNVGEVNQLITWLMFAKTITDRWKEISAPPSLVRCDKCGTDYTPGHRTKICPHDLI